MNIVRLTRRENVSCERQVKFVQERISSTEDNLSNLHQSFGGYVKHLAKLRDKNDDVATAVYNYSNKEVINRSVKFCLNELAEILATVGDCRELQIKNLDTKVVQEFSQYDTICRNAKSEVRSICGAKDREHNRRSHLNKIRERTPHKIKEISKAEAELVKATAEVTRMQKALEEHADIFEKKKLQDIKLILKNFVLEELSYHARAIRLFTSACNCIDKMNENGDLEEFRDVLKVPEIASRLEIVQKAAIGTPKNVIVGNLQAGSLEFFSNLQGHGRSSSHLERDNDQPVTSDEGSCGVESQK